MTVVSSGVDQITISWSSVAEADYYEIYRNTSNISDGAAKIGSRLSTAGTAFKSTGLIIDTAYYYWLKACNVDYCSAFSNSLTAVTGGAFILNDTGLILGGDYSSGNNVDCSGETISAQDCSHGRDAQFLSGTLVKTGGGNAGFDFTKLGADGSVLAIQNAAWDDNGNESAGTRWSCVKDNHTGLYWEVKNNDSGIHNKNNTYRWGGKTAIGLNHDSKENTYYNDWDTLLDGANTGTYGGGTGLCGFTDWVVSNREKLLTIVDYSVVLPTIDTNYFPNTYQYGSWSASPGSYLDNSVWTLFFSNGTYYFIQNKDSFRAAVRLVRSGS